MRDKGDKTMIMMAIVWHKELCSVLCNDLYGKRVDVCITDSLSTPETNNENQLYTNKNLKILNKQTQKNPLMVR